MNTTKEEELDSRYIITEPGYKYGKLIRQSDKSFHCPHIGCDYSSMFQTGMGMHRKTKHGHKTVHSDRYRKQWVKTKKESASREPKKRRTTLGPNSSFTGVPETRVEHIAGCKFCPRCGFHLEPVNISMSITGNGVRIL